MWVILLFLYWKLKSMWFIYHSLEDESTIVFGICGKQVFAIVNKQKLSLDVFHKKRYSQNLQGKTYAGFTFIIKSQVKGFIKKRLQYKYFLENFAKFLGTLFWKTSANSCFQTNTSGFLIFSGDIEREYWPKMN